MIEMEDKDGLGTAGLVPFITINLPPSCTEQYRRMLSNMTPVWAEADGKNILEVKNDKGEIIGYKAYILFFVSNTMFADK